MTDVNFNIEEIKQKIIKNIKNVYDPEIPVNIYDLGLIYNIEFEERGNYLFCFITMTLTSPGCPVADSLLAQVKYITMAVDEVDECHVQLTFEPMWDMNQVTPEGRDMLIASGVQVPQY